MDIFTVFSSSSKRSSPSKSSLISSPSNTPKRSRNTIISSELDTSVSPLSQQVNPPVVKLKQSKRMGVKVFNDLIHTHITIEGLCLEIVNTPQYQRLHGLRQLGCTDYVFRAAKHTRFEHSLGVAHLAEKMVRTFQKNQPYLNITETDVLCVKIAGLCHDLGHGPYSHLYDGVFMKQMNPNGKWRHEDGSVRMLQYLLRDNHINVANYGLSETDETFIHEIISGTSESKRVGRPSNKFYLYDIVNNSRSGLDVDKLDYFQRDMKMTNVTIVSSASFERFIFLAKILPSEPIEKISLLQGDTAPLMICYPEKQVPEAVELFGARFKMHNNVYQHKCVKQLEYMITDVLMKADPYIQIMGTKNNEYPDGRYRISQCIDDMCAFSKLKDSILDIISHDPNPLLEPAKELIRRIDKRQLYRCVGKTSFCRGDEISKLSEQQIKLELLEISRDEGFLNNISVDCDFPPSQNYDILGSSDYSVIDNTLSQSSYMYAISDTELSRQGSNFSSANTSSPRRRRPLNEDDVIVEKMHIHYGLKEKNPVARMRFYVKNESNFGREVSEDRYVTSLPRSFESQGVRIFCRSMSKTTQATLSDAFKYWCRMKSAHSPLPSFSQHQDDDGDDIRADNDDV